MKSDRDVDKAYPRADFVAKLRRLADALEAQEAFEIQIAGERLHVPARAIVSMSMSAKRAMRKSSFSCAGSAILSSYAPAILNGGVLTKELRWLRRSAAFSSKSCSLMRKGLTPPSASSRSRA